MIDKELARAMRGHGLTLAEIGDELGVSRERIRQVTVDVRIQRACRECGTEIPPEAHANRRFCGRKCAVRHHNARLYGRCQCGSPKTAQSELCVGCRRAEWDRERSKKHDRLAVLWAEGLPMAEIAVRLKTTENSLGVMVHRARAAGVDLPLRRANTPKRGPLTKAECRFQFSGALMQGKIRRPARCEECGERCHVEGHHVDYNRPLFVFWLCPDCHELAHGNIPRSKAAA